MPVMLKNGWIAVSDAHRELKYQGEGVVGHGVVMDTGEGSDVVDMGDTIIYERDMVIVIDDGDSRVTMINESSVIAVVTQ